MPWPLAPHEAKATRAGQEDTNNEASRIPERLPFSFKLPCEFDFNIHTHEQELGPVESAHVARSQKHSSPFTPSSSLCELLFSEVLEA